eukprot:gene12364-13634_t
MEVAQEQQNLVLLTNTPLSSYENERITWAPRKEKSYPSFANFCRRCVSDGISCQCSEETGMKKQPNRKLNFYANEDIESSQNKISDESTPCSNMRQFKTPCSKTKSIESCGSFYPSANECDTATEVNNYQRSTAFIIDPTSTSAFCDIPWRYGWYHFTSKAGQQIPTTCPPINSCGTTGSIWSDGTLPTAVGNYSAMNACVRVRGNCCAATWPIRVKKCSKDSKEYFVYLLQRPTGCSMAYCAGSEKPCPVGTNSPNGFTPGCTKNFPLVTSNPVVTPATHNNRLQFRCEFKSDDKDQHSVFEVTWYQGAPSINIGDVTILKGNSRIATIQNTNKYPNDPTFYLGQTISCRVRSWFSYSSNKTSSYKESNHFYAGITVEPRQLKFKTTEAGKPLKLTVKSTVPIVCEQNKACSVLVDLGQDNTQNFLDLCTIVFKPGPAGQSRIVEVVAKRDFINDGDRMMILKVDVLEHIDPVDWNQHKPVPNIQILAVDVGTAQCRSSGDPHLLTFDKLYYNHYQVGDYVLVNSTCRRFEVHVRTWKCSSVSCNCGVAVREGDDVVVVDMCRDKIPRARFASTSNPADGTSIKRDNNGKSFIVTFPSGAFVRVDILPWGSWYYANFVIQVPSDDHGCTNGLCGTFDGEKSNEMIDKNGKVYKSLGRGNVAPPGFAESWKLPVGSSLFYYKGGTPKCDAKRAKHYCTCKELCCGKRIVDCNFKNIAHRPKYYQGLKGWKNLKFPGGQHCGRRRRRRSTTTDIVLPEDNVATGYIYDPSPIIKFTPPQWPTASGKTKNNVTSHCTDRIMSSEPGEVCKSIPDFDFSPFIEQCIEDVQITDNYTFVGSAIRTMQDACEEVFLTNTSFWELDASKNNSLQPPVAIANTLCPNLCSGNGKCVNATCVCNVGFVSADCSIEKNKGPTVQTIAFDGICDVRKRSDCFKIRINGYDFLDSDQLKCRATQLKISDKQPFEKSSIKIVGPAFLLSFAEVLCELKGHAVKIKGDAKNSTGVAFAGYAVDVSNDGKTFSRQSALYHVYDSKCITCTPYTGTCSIKPGTCLINGYCFKNGEKHASDVCAVCDSTQNVKSFSTAPEPQCATSKKINNKRQEKQTNNSVVVIVCGVLGGAVFIAIVVAAFIITKKKKNKKQRQKTKRIEVTYDLNVKSSDPKNFVNASFDS